MTTMFDSYATVTSTDVLRHLQQLEEPLKGKTVIHVNSTRAGNGDNGGIRPRELSVNSSIAGASDLNGIVTTWLG
jgi:hypothetical protein